MNSFSNLSEQGRHYRNNPNRNEKGFRECHIKDDWLLKYVKDKSTLVLVLTRTGTHRDLFGAD